ncbi:MAG: hypothetical protein RLZZ136_596 [Pseudomonadota bacterium]|jgi:uncharacterized protein YjeT (DUF2065 family)
MPQPLDAPAWSSLMLGMAAIFAGLGALRKPGIWRTMVGEIEQSPTLQFLSGMLELLTGVIVYLANPFAPADVLSCVMKGIGGLMMIEALAIIGFCDIYTQLWLRSLSHMHRGWALFTLLLGLGLTMAGAMRFN